MKITPEDVAEVIRNSGREVKEIDFSIFHPLDHWAFSRDCFGWYGGPLQHLRLWWEFQRPGWDKDWEPVETNIRRKKGD
jgi:hypothetical protein